MPKYGNPNPTSQLKIAKSKSYHGPNHFMLTDSSSFDYIWAT
ncbi:hypothetical protein SAMN05444414_10649 [Roseovarius marisflavi]|uniref:Uncharacterized protein n=1 Tax=Roseovarius marisflavi TaxID=1054996 RepID=A0A1M6Y9X3_9RHOB|nr:hypothetical protein SAMN05444414_10649 [Roseovarius marisflavi]